MQAPDQLAVETELERILSSKVFKSSTVISNFLRYVVIETLGERTHEIKEYSIAVKAFGKPLDFNPQTDAVIRIHAGRLRRGLLAYYNEEGKHDTIIISLKKGSYIPEFTVIDKTNELSTSVPLPVGHSHKSVAFSRVAVLPFINVSGREENNFIVDGFCEQLSSDLAQFPEIAVIAYYSTLKFRGERQDIRKVGKELNTSYLITGSIFRDEKHLRISVQLVDAVTGAQLWTQTYDRAIQTDYLYEIFDDVIKQVIPRLTGYYGLINRSVIFSTQLDPLIDQDTIDAVFWYYHYQVINTEEVFQTVRLRIENALQQNPSYALAWAILAQIYVDGIANSYTTVSEPLQEANKCVEKALQLDHDCQHAYLSLTWIFIFLRDRNKAIESLDHCISINPRSAFFLGASSFLYGLLGEYDKSMKYFDQTNTLNPYYPWWVNLGPFFTHFSNGNFTGAFEYANRIHIPGVLWDAVFKIAALGQLSRIEEAINFANEFQVQFPKKTEVICSILKAILFDELVYERIKAGLYNAGLPV